MRYTIEISEKQAEIIKIALEEYFRLRMNLTWDFADDICFEGFDYDNCTNEDFDKQLEKRNVFRKEFEKLLIAVHPLQLGGGKFREATVEMRRAQDIWQVVRHQLWTERHGIEDDWCVDSRKPMSMTGEALPVMKVIEE